ncbi:hypothetical protein TgHK011_007578 [Trichoderma gracile]|nr:hypothetical protein TgHK011_007578 [Trichoderma gracile]
MPGFLPSHPSLGFPFTPQATRNLSLQHTHPESAHSTHSLNVQAIYAKETLMQTPATHIPVLARIDSSYSTADPPSV